MGLRERCGAVVCAALLCASAAAHAGEGAGAPESGNSAAVAALYRIEEASRDTRTSLFKVTYTFPAPDMALLRAFYDVATSRGAPYFIALKEWGGVEGVHWFLVGFSPSRDIVPTEYFGLGFALPEGIEENFVAADEFAKWLARQAEPVPAGPAGVPAAPYAALVTSVARELKLEPALLHAVVAVESGYNANAKSPKGARGLMQLMPDTAARYGVADVWNPLDNLRGGARYLRDLLALFEDDLALALAAYNAGEGAVSRAGNRIPPYSETQRYVPKVLQHYERYRAAPKP